MMISTRCPSPAELRSLSNGQLPESESDAFFEHLRQCDDCRAEMQEIEQSEDSLIATLRAPTAKDFDGEPDCRIAVARALGTLSEVSVGKAQPYEDLSNTPEKIGEYEIIRPLGQGGMGQVYLARHTKLGRQVALKILASHRLHDGRMRERFEQEMRAIGQLSHPNIVTAHDAREVGGTAVLVTEFIEGMDLGELVRRTGPLGVADACEILRQVAVALAYTHERGFVHRDVKPSNVMLSELGEVKLLDLGLARLQFGDVENAEITGTGQAMGTADYVAPEQVTDSRSVDARADVYSLGCTLFKLLSGGAPFADAQHLTAFAKMHAHVATDPPQLDQLRTELPNDLCQLVDAMLRKSPQERPQSAEKVAEALARYSTGSDLPGLVMRARDLQPVASSPRASSLSPRTKPILRRPIPSWTAILTGVLGVAIGLCMGILIKIEYPDGTSQTILVPSGGTVKTEYVADGTQAPPEDISPEAAGKDFGVENALDQFDEVRRDAFSIRSLGYQALAFGILTELSSLEPQQKQQAIDSLDHTSKGIFWVPDSNFAWFPATSQAVAELEDSSSYATVGANPQKFLLLRCHSDSFISFEEIEGKTLQSRVSITSSGQELLFRFEKPLDQRMFEMTQEHLQKRLAVIVDGQIVSLPRIVAPIRDRAVVRGSFFPGATRKLFQRLNGGLVNDPFAAPGQHSPFSPSQPAPGATSNGSQFQQQSSTPRVNSLRNNARQESGRESGAQTNQNQSPLGSEGRTSSGQRTTDPFADDPFGAPARAKSQRSASPDKDPFHSSSNDPFGVSSPEPGNPFRGTADGSGNDPFGGASSSGSSNSFDPFNASQDPFDSGSVKQSQSSSSQDPFGANPAPGSNDPFGGSPQQANPFRSSSQPPTSSRDPNAVEVEENGLAPQEQDRAQSNLRRIGIAFHRYAAKHRSFPGSANLLQISGNGETRDGGKPYSWRVALLPYLGHQDLYDRYRFDEAWNSPHNKKLLDEMPDVYKSAQSEHEPGMTCYLGIASENSGLGTGSGHRIQEFTDGTSYTLLVLNAACSLEWTRPEDYPAGDNIDLTNLALTPQHPLQVLTADGEVHSLDPQDLDLLEKMATRNGGEKTKLPQ